MTTKKCQFAGSHRNILSLDCGGGYKNLHMGQHSQNCIPKESQCYEEILGRWIEGDNAGTF